MNQNNLNNENNPNMNDINAMNQMILNNQLMIMNQLNYLNNMNNQLMQNMNMNNMVNNMNNPLMQNWNMDMMNPNVNNFNNMPNRINIIFKSEDQESLTINANYDDKISSVISKYKILINDGSNNKDYYFLNKRISPDLTIGEQGLTNNCEIEVRKKNINENNNKDLFKKEKNHHYKDLKSGINIIGKCCNKKCRLKDQQVISNWDKKEFEFVSNLYNVLCPHCSSIIIPKKIAFYQCSFIISGKKVDGDKVVPFSFNNIIEINNKNNFYLFEPENNKDTTYVEILCQVFKTF